MATGISSAIVNPEFDPFCCKKKCIRNDTAFSSLSEVSAGAKTLTSSECTKNIPFKKLL